jgi:hypothetical protein
MNIFGSNEPEFRNKLAKRIEGISTTPYNARSNGCVENHNRTMKDQLYHFVESRQKRTGTSSCQLYSRCTTPR